MMSLRNVSRRTLAWGAALLLWVAFVWGHSLIGGTASSAESGRVVALLRPLFQAVGVSDANLMTFVVRKAAHFSEYAVLGAIARTFWVRLAAELAAPRVALLTLGTALTALVPCLDETIQLFVPGRCGSARDVLIDLSGAVTGAFICWLFSRVKTRER